MGAAQQHATFIDDLASVLFTPDNITRANDYLATVRKIDPAQLRFPWVYSGSDPNVFNHFRGAYPPIIFTDSLYIPIPDIGDPTGRTLAGFDVRYLGPAQNRLRYHKFRRDPDSPLFYNFHAALQTNKIIVAEGAIDVEAIRACGHEAVGALTALGTPKFLYFLLGLADHVYFMFDNDQDGRGATEKLMHK